MQNEALLQYKTSPQIAYELLPIRKRKSQVEESNKQAINNDKANKDVPSGTETAEIEAQIPAQQNVNDSENRGVEPQQYCSTEPP